MRIRRVFAEIAVFHLGIVKGRVILVQNSFDDIVVDVERLDDHLPAVCRPAAASGSLHQKIEGRLRGVVVLVHQPGVSIQDTD